MKKTKRAPLRMIRVKLAKSGAKVPNPSTGKTIPEGAVVEVPDAPYWHRRLRDGVVVLADAAPEKTSETKTEGEKKPSETKTETSKK